MDCTHEPYVMLGNGVKQCFGKCQKLLVPERLKSDYDYPQYRDRVIVMNGMIEKPGRYQITTEDYHSDKDFPQPCLSNSIIKSLIYESPAHAWYNHPKLNPNYQPDYGNGKFDLGSAAHALLLEGVDNMAVVDAEDWRKKEAKEAREIARLSGKTPLLKHQYEDAKKMVDAAVNQIMLCRELGITDLRTQGDSEVTYVWQEKETWLKVRLDWIRKDKSLILDYKTTENANPADVGRLITNLHYEIQNAFYRRAVQTVEGIDPRFVFMVQEVSEPWFCSFIELSDALLEMAEQEITNGIFLWRECMESGKWPGYPNKVVTIDTPNWAFTNWQNRCLKIGADL